MKNLDSFLKLSHFLKCYRLYQNFTEMDERNRNAILKIESNLSEKTTISKSEEEELEQYHQVLEKIDFNNKLLENSFNNYDFGEDAVKQALTDYKLYAFEFIVDTISESIMGKEFKHSKDAINHVRTAEKVIRKHFISKFYVIEDLDKIFEKATESILEQLLSWDTSVQKDNIKILK
ncbi:MAG: hypothetical protein OEV44_10515 [Spirochaetota bacterium]|nr:hypothetical protein [Spirochaetota bacterium]